MRKYVVVLAVLAAALSAGLVGQFVLIERFAPGLTPPAAFLSATPVVKLVMILGILTLAPTLVVFLLGLGQHLSGRPPARAAGMLLWIFGSGVIVWGVLGGLYGEVNTRAGIAAVGGGVSFGATVPGRVESLLCLSIGLSVGLVAIGGAALLKSLRRRRSVNSFYGGAASPAED